MSSAYAAPAAASVTPSPVNPPTILVATAEDSTAAPGNFTNLATSINSPPSVSNSVSPFALTPNAAPAGSNGTNTGALLTVPHAGGVESRLDPQSDMSALGDSQLGSARYLGVSRVDHDHEPSTDPTSILNKDNLTVNMNLSASASASANPTPSNIGKSKSPRHTAKSHSATGTALSDRHGSVIHQLVKPILRGNKVSPGDLSGSHTPLGSNAGAWNTHPGSPESGSQEGDGAGPEDGIQFASPNHMGQLTKTDKSKENSHVNPPLDDDDGEVENPLESQDMKTLFRPDSNFLTYWSYCLLFFAGYNALTISYRWAFWIHDIPMDPETVIQIVIDALSDLFFWGDIYISLNTAIIDNGQIITDRKQIRQAYFQSWFALDVITCIPLDLIQFGPNRMLPWTRGFKILRIFHILHHIQRIEENTSVSFKFRLGKLVFYTFFIAHFVSCVKFKLFLMPADPHYEHVVHASPFSAYLQSLAWAMGSITGRDNTAPPETYEDCVFTVVMMLVGVLWLAYIIASLEQFSATSTSNSKFQQKVKYVSAFMHAFKVPQNIQIRVQNYYSYLWSSSERFESEEIIKKLPTSLQTDLKWSFYRSILEKAEIFRYVEKGFLNYLVHHLEPMITIPREVVFERDQEGQDMYFIQDGEVEILITARMTNIATLRVGDYFGEYALFSSDHHKRTATARSMSYCTLLKLSHKDLMKAMSLYPLSDKRIRSQVTEHRARTLQQEQNLLGLDKSGNANSKLKKLINVDDNETKQTRHHPYTIDPKSLFYRIWQFVSVAYSLYNLISLPIRFGFEPNSDNAAILFFDYSGDLFFICDIIINFRLRYTEKGTDVSDPSLIRYRYLRSWFFLHVLASIPLDFIMLATGMQPLFRLNRNLRMIQVHTTIMNKLKDTSRIEVTSLMYLIANFLFLSHWASCIYYSFTRLEGFAHDWEGWRPNESIQSASEIYQYFWAQYFALAHLSGIGRHTFPPSDLDVLFSVSIMLIGCFVVSYIIGKMGHLMLSLDAKAHDFKREYQYVQQLLEYKKVDSDVSGRINDYLKHLWESQKGIDPNVALADLPLQLRTDIMMFICEDMIRSVPRFQGLDDAFIRQLVSELTFIELPVNEWIFRQGQIGTEMYFISSGLVEILLEVAANPSPSHAINMQHSRSSHNLLMEASDAPATFHKLKVIGAGSFFGEGALFHGTRAASVRCKTPCQLLCLSEASFKKVMAMHPRFARKITRLNKDRQDRLWSVMKEVAEAKEEHPMTNRGPRFSLPSIGGESERRHSRIPSYQAPPKLLPPPIGSDQNSLFLPSTIATPVKISPNGSGQVSINGRQSPNPLPGAIIEDVDDATAEHSDSDSMESVDRTHQVQQPIGRDTTRHQMPEYTRRKSTVASVHRAQSDFSSVATSKGAKSASPRVDHAAGTLNIDSLPVHSFSFDPTMFAQKDAAADAASSDPAQPGSHPRSPSMALFGRHTSLDRMIQDIENHDSVPATGSDAAEETRRTPPINESQEPPEEKSSPSDAASH